MRLRRSLARAERLRTGRPRQLDTRRSGEIVAGNVHAPVRRCVEGSNDVQQGGLAAARRTKHDDEPPPPTRSVTSRGARHRPQRKHAPATRRPTQIAGEPTRRIGAISACSPREPVSTRRCLGSVARPDDCRTARRSRALGHRTASRARHRAIALTRPAWAGNGDQPSGHWRRDSPAVRRRGRSSRTTAPSPSRAPRGRGCKWPCCRR
jgi:hypothetical protein